MHTYSLGNQNFIYLATLVRQNKNLWRKVARMLNHYNRLAAIGMKPSMGSAYRHLEAKRYLARALQDTKLPFTVKYEIMLVMGLWNDAIERGIAAQAYPELKRHILTTETPISHKEVSLVNRLTAGQNLLN